ncbi:MAG TPA: hypothetical protein VFN27_16925 [Xanthobacteraceae bacterium]|nr:hypothetical protein [Xanthobacteraceae bacterium]
MAGLSDYLAEFAIEFASGQQPVPAIGNRFLALFTTAPTSDAGTGGTEVSGGAYARVQIAGAVAATASFTTASPNITMTTNPGWVVPGMNVYDLTNGKQIGTVSTYVGTALVLTANAANASSGAADSLQFSAFPAAAASSGTEPSVTPSNAANGAVITFAQATASWGTVTSWGIYDAVTAGNLLWWDYLGNFKWLPFSGTSASPSVLTAPAHGYANGDPVVVTAKFGGTLPATAGSWAGVLTVAGAATDSFNVGVNSTGTGDGEVRKIVQQPIAANVTASFAASAFTLSMA